MRIHIFKSHQNAIEWKNGGAPVYCVDHEKCSSEFRTVNAVHIVILLNFISNYGTYRTNRMHSSHMHDVYRQCPIMASDNRRRELRTKNGTTNRISVDCHYYDLDIF